MMRRYFALILCFFLTCMPLRVLGEGISLEDFDYTGSKNYIWDIPLNIPIDEFVEKAYENTGFLFEATEDGSRYIVDTSKQAISMLGYPLRGAIAAVGDPLFNQPEYDGKFSGLSLGFDWSADTLALTRDLYSSITGKFGSPTGGYLSADSKYYDPPFLDGELDVETVERVLLETDSCSITITWTNISLNIGGIANDDGERRASVSLSERNYVRITSGDGSLETLGRYADVVRYIGDADAGI